MSTGTAAGIIFFIIVVASFLPILFFWYSTGSYCVKDETAETRATLRRGLLVMAAGQGGQAVAWVIYFVALVGQAGFYASMLFVIPLVIYTCLFMCWKGNAEAYMKFHGDPIPGNAANNAVAAK